MNVLALIEGKREGRELSQDEIQRIIQDYTRGDIPDYQMAALLMAIYFQGLNPTETRALTLAMRDSGDTLKFPRDSRPLVDKHSTGGVGDKVSLPLAPLLAALGFRVPMISGRGLGITGGTLDKLDSIPGFRTTLASDEILEAVDRVGCVICGQTDRMAPADKKLYALRDVTGTVPSIPLIVASILSKKLAEGLDALVLDVKFGVAAFMSTRNDARKLARAMVDLGRNCDVNTRAILTSMDIPLGRAAGNWLEVKEAVACLEQDGSSPDLEKLVITCAAQLLVMTRKSKTMSAATRLARDCVVSGVPRAKWDEMLVAQGADLKAFKAMLAEDVTAPVTLELTARRAGFVTKCNARLIGEIIRDLGGGRLTKDSLINHDVGIDRLRKPGEKVKPGSVLARLHAADEASGQTALTRLTDAITIGPRPPKPTRLVHQQIV